MSHVPSYHGAIKRCVDLLISAVGLAVSSPAMIVIGTAIRLEDGQPALFKQERVGRRGKSFVIYKFRSMPIGTASKASADLGGSPTTRVGRWIRRTNLDELPQLLNILRGEMSVVGPRPPLTTQTVLISERSVGPSWDLRPGLTGLAQVSSFDGMDERQKASYDNLYAMNVTFAGDVKILARTFFYLLKPPPTY